MSCNQICKKYKATGSPAQGRYSSGQKRCQNCEIYIIWHGHADDPQGLLCPCCKVRLRTKPRNKNYKDKHKVRMAKKIILESTT